MLPCRQTPISDAIIEERGKGHSALLLDSSLLSNATSPNRDGVGASITLRALPYHHPWSGHQVEMSRVSSAQTRRSYTATYCSAIRLLLHRHVKREYMVVELTAPIIQDAEDYWTNTRACL